MDSYKIRSLVATMFALVFALSPALADDGSSWDQKQAIALAAALHENVRGLRDELRAVPKDIGSMKAWAYYRLLDDLRLIERETKYLHKALASGAGPEETLPTYLRIASLRKDCEEEMERLHLGAGMLERIKRARSVVKQLDALYGVDSEHANHERVLERMKP